MYGSWLDSLLTIIGSLGAGVGGSVLYFRPKLKQAKADAAMKETEAQNFAYESLLNRIDLMEKHYAAQYEAQAKTIEGLRKELIDMGKEKFETEQRMLKVEQENKALREKVEQLEREINAQKIGYSGDGQV